MKKAILILTALLLAATVAAQPHGPGAPRYEKNILGVRAGVNISKLDVSAEGAAISTGWRTGFYFAVADQILLTRKLPLYLETGVNFSSRGGKALIEAYGQMFETTLNPFYIQVPLLLNYHFVIRDLLTIQPFAGIYGGAGLRGMMKTDSGKADLFRDPGFLKRLDFGVRAGVGFTVRRVFLGVSYDIGCMNQLRGGEFYDYSIGPENVEVRNGCLTISLGYNF